MRYVVVIPAKNEARGISVTIDSILSQSILPLKVLIVDDGSTDNMAEVVRRYEEMNDVLQYHLNESQESTYTLGGKIVSLLFKGKSLLDKIIFDYDYIIKMDADVWFEPDFIKKISERISSGNYGIVSGTPFITENGRRVFIVSPEWHTNGDFKIYSRKFLEMADNFPMDLGWDCADNLLAREKGFKTEAFRDINYRQNRPIGRFSSVKGRQRQGLGAYKLRYSWGYLALKAILDLIKPPYIVGSVYYLAGYFGGKFGKLPKTVNKNQKKLLQRLMWQSFTRRFKDRNFFIFHLFPKKN